jgi:WD40 repeat protein
LNKSNIFCLVGGGVSPKYAPNKLLLWDDKKGKEIYEFRFNSFIVNCFIKLKYIFVFCKDTINIISMKTMKTVEVILTFDNKDGIGTISSAINKYILCWPDLSKGNIAIKDFSELKSSSVTISTSNQDKNSLFKNKLSFQLHESRICFLKLNDQGDKLATASERGNIIRIFDTIKGCVIQELKRGSGDAKIYSINFSFDNNFVAITSDHGTAHIFVINKDMKKIKNILSQSSKLIENVKDKNENDDKDKKNDFGFDIIDNDDVKEKEEEEEINEDNNKKEIENIKNEDNNKKNDFEIINEEMTKSDVIENSNNYKKQKSLLSGVSKMIGFSSIFQTEWSFASFKIPYKQQSFISFIQGEKNDNKLIVIDKEGNYTVSEINEKK